MTVLLSHLFFCSSVTLTVMAGVKRRSAGFRSSSTLMKVSECVRMPEGKASVQVLSKHAMELGNTTGSMAVL